MSVLSPSIGLILPGLLEPSHVGDRVATDDEARLPSLSQRHDLSDQECCASGVFEDEEVHGLTPREVGFGRSRDLVDAEVGFAEVADTLKTFGRDVT